MILGISNITLIISISFNIFLINDILKIAKTFIKKSKKTRIWLWYNKKLLKGVQKVL